MLLEVDSFDFLKENLHKIDLPLVMAKVTYAIHLYETEHEDELKFSKKALLKLIRMRNGNANKGLFLLASSDFPLSI